MKKILLISISIILAANVVFAKPKTKRVDADTIVDLDGFWNDSDIRIVCETLLADCIESPRVAKFEEQNGRPPTVIIGKIKNESSERIDTSIIAKRLQTAIINSGVLEFVASGNERDELRAEVQQQSEHASLETAGAIDNEEGADFMMTGSVKTQVQTAGKQSVRTYFVYMTLTNLSTHRIMWQGENSEIKKVIKK